MDQARKVQSTIVPIEDTPLRRPYLKPKNQSVEVDQTATSSRHVAANRSMPTVAAAEEKPASMPSESTLAMVTAEVIERLGDQLTNQPVDKATLKQYVREQLGQWRPMAWEDDISRNTLDAKPYENLASPASLESDQFYGSKDFVQYALSKIDDDQLKSMIAKDIYPIPCAEDREGYSPGYDGVYWMSGLVDYLKIMEVCERFGLLPRSCFDFGCATGRVLRHFAVQSNCETVWGSDINRRHVRWLQEFMPEKVRPVFNHCIPTLPIPDGSVDVVSAFSVFTHIDTFETCWLAELNRILSNKGVCYLTVHNEATWEVLREEIDNPKNRLVQSIRRVDPNFTDKLMGPMPDQRTVWRFTNFGPYRAQVFHSNNYLQRVWGRFFHIEEILPCHHVRQSVVVLRKK